MVQEAEVHTKWDQNVGGAGCARFLRGCAMWQLVYFHPIREVRRWDKNAEDWKIRI